MGCFDTVMVPCPDCGLEEGFQSKSGICHLEVWSLKECPSDILVDVNRHSPHYCKCESLFEVDITTRKSVKVW
jgi:hypothetical protein